MENLKGTLVNQPRKKKPELRLKLNEVKEALKNRHNWQSARAPVMAAQTEVLRSRQQKIEHALQMIALGEYGFCEHCGEQIPPETPGSPT